MKRKVYILLSLLLILSTLSLLLVGCDTQAERIVFNKIKPDNLLDEDIEKQTDEKISLIVEGSSNYKIVLNEGSTRSLVRSVEDMVDTIEEMSGVRLMVVHKSEDDGSNYIYIDSASNVTLDGVEHDGAVIDVADDIHIKGNSEMASRNGIYLFLTEYLDVIFVSSDDNYIPHHQSIYLPRGCKVFNPKTAWRDIYSYEVVENNWSDKLLLNAIDTEKLDSEYDIDDSLDAHQKQIRINELRQYNNWGTWCHSMYTFLSPEEYYESHPEYFSMKGGKRIHIYKERDAHLCLSNEEVYNIVESRLANMIEENPDIKYWDFSINDNSWVAGCECDECKKMDREAGGTGMGSLLPFINRLARRFPDKYICTLAYFHTLKPPTNIKCESNVVIKLCSMPGDQASSYREPTNHNAQVFHDSVTAWSQICDHIVIWDYVVDFSHLLMPFPNLAVQGANQQFYEQNKIEGIFHQASREAGSEMSYLRAYILSKLMWYGGELDVANEVSRYVYAYYGNAGDAIIDYLNALHNNLADSRRSLGLYDSTVPHLNGYLSEENIDEYNKILDRAKCAVDGNNKYIERIERIEMSVKYAELLLPNISGDRRSDVRNRCEYLAQKNNIDMTCEWESLDDFYNNLDNNIKNIQRSYNMPKYITIIVTLIVVIVGILLVILIRHRAKRKVASITNKKEEYNSDNIE